jgi:hypothetical protein
MITPLALQYSAATAADSGLLHLQAGRTSLPRRRLELRTAGVLPLVCARAKKHQDETVGFHCGLYKKLLKREPSPLGHRKSSQLHRFGKLPAAILAAGSFSVLQIGIGFGKTRSG